MKYNKKIPIEDDTIKSIIKAIEDGENEYYDVYYENPTITQNGKGAAIWNYINTSLSHSLEGTRYKVGILSRGIWKLVYLYDEETKYLYTFMRKQNYDSIRKMGSENNLLHYSNLLSVLNGELLDTYEPEFKQMSWFKQPLVENITEEEFDYAFQGIIESIDENVERYAIVLFDLDHCHMRSVECIIPVENMNTLYTEDWSSHIQVEYEGTNYLDYEVRNDDNVQGLNNSEDDIDLSIQKQELKIAK